jgi:uncharacterized protein YoxC
MDITLTLYDLGLFIVFVLVVVAVVYLILTMKKVYDLLGHAQRTLQTNEANINKTFSTLPVLLERTEDIAANLQLGAREFGATAPIILQNVSALSGSLKNSADIVVHSVDVIGMGISETAGTVKDNLGDVITYIKIITEAVRYIVHYFSSK